jgi:L-cysteine S-thiosulfotransferase
MWRWLSLLLLAGSVHAQTHTATQRSSFFDMGTPTQALQRDNTQNPAMLWVQDGERLLKTPSSANGKACVSCHSPQDAKFQTVALRYPATDAHSGKVINLPQRINTCRTRHQGLTELSSESESLLALHMALSLPVRGQPIAPPAMSSDPALRAAHAHGERLWLARMGQLNLSCAQCHDARSSPGSRLGASPIPQAHPTGYPIYRLEWQAPGSLARRVRGCMTGVRATPFAPFSPEMTALEVYLAARATGMQLEAPGVRP